MDPHTITLLSTVGTVGFLINSSINVSRRIFEIKDVGKQAQAILEISNNVKRILQQARKLQRQKSQLLSPLEKEMIDGQLDSTEKAISNLAMLVEPARVDMVIHGSVCIATRTMFLIRDSPKITASLNNLGIAYQGLNTAIGILCGRNGNTASAKHGPPTETKLSPPSYEESQFLNSKRHSVIFRVEPVEMGIEDVETIRQAQGNRALVEVWPAVLCPGPDSEGLQVDERQQTWWHPALDHIRPPQHHPDSLARPQTPHFDSNGVRGVAPASRFGGRSRGQNWLAHRASFQEGRF